MSHSARDDLASQGKPAEAGHKQGRKPYRRPRLRLLGRIEPELLGSPPPPPGQPPGWPPRNPY